MHFQLEIQKCILSKGDRSALQVGESKVHLKLEISKVFYIIWKSFDQLVEFHGQFIFMEFREIGQTPTTA